jgi:hypothetical protein
MLKKCEYILDRKKSYFEYLIKLFCRLNNAEKRERKKRWGEREKGEERVS